MKSIVLIFPYFGKLPVQYKMWRESALRNPTVDFMFFTASLLSWIVPTYCAISNPYMEKHYSNIFQNTISGAMAIWMSFMETLGLSLQKKCFHVISFS